MRAKDHVRKVAMQKLFYFLLPFAAIWNLSGLASEDNPVWLTVEIGIIGVASDDVLKSALTTANERDYQGLIIQLDTAGGSLEATRSMVKDILAASIPVVVWVGPAGAHAGSAGSFIT